MDYKTTFSYCLKKECPESKHQFHYKHDFEPDEFDFEQWLIGKLYCITLMEEIGEYVYAIDYDYPIEKEKQIHEFLDFHFSKYKSSLANFKLSLSLVLKLFKNNPNINTLYYNGVNEFITDWMNEKIDNRKIIESEKPMNFAPICSINKIENVYAFLNGSYLSEISDRNHFDYVFGMIDSCADFKPLNWRKTLKDLNAFIDTFYSNEPRKWEKAIYCFTWNGNPIKKKSLSTAIDKYDNAPESKIHFQDLYQKLK